MWPPVAFGTLADAAAAPIGFGWQCRECWNCRKIGGIEVEWVICACTWAGRWARGLDCAAGEGGCRGG